ncbi:MAG: hypothetical protein ACLQOO_06410 [Terriglobia bacterium]
MRHRMLVAVGLALLLSVAAAAQMPDGYLDVGIARVKPDKRTDFDSVSKKMAEANRKNHGDTWIAMETTYGENNVVTFVSNRSSYADTEKASDAFVGALNKAGGPGAAGKWFQEFNNTVVSYRSEFRHRRWDLSANPPADPAAYFKLVGEARWLRTARVRVKPGRALDYEAQLLAIKAAAEKASEKPVTLVSQAVAGQDGTVYYISWLAPSPASFDGGPSLRQMLGEDSFQSYLKAVEVDVQGSETTIYHILPELSNPPAEVAAVSPDFWTPKPKAAPKPKPKAEAAKPEAKQ